MFIGILLRVVFPLKELSFTTAIVDVDSHRLLNNHKLVYRLINIDPNIMFVFTAIMGCGLLWVVQTNSPGSNVITKII
jgi:hypothetical protein